MKIEDKISKYLQEDKYKFTGHEKDLFDRNPAPYHVGDKVETILWGSGTIAKIFSYKEYIMKRYGYNELDAEIECKKDNSKFRYLFTNGKYFADFEIKKLIKR